MHDAMMSKIGDMSNEDLLFCALHYLIMYNLRKGDKTEKEYGIDEAFKEAVRNGKQKIHPMPELIPSPS